MPHDQGAAAIAAGGRHHGPMDQHHRTIDAVVYSSYSSEHARRVGSTQLTATSRLTERDRMSPRVFLVPPTTPSPSSVGNVEGGTRCNAMCKKQLKVGRWSVPNPNQGPACSTRLFTYQRAHARASQVPVPSLSGPHEHRCQAGYHMVVDVRGTFARCGGAI